MGIFLFFDQTVIKIYGEKGDRMGAEMGEFWEIRAWMGDGCKIIGILAAQTRQLDNQIKPIIINSQSMRNHPNPQKSPSKTFTLSLSHTAIDHTTTKQSTNIEVASSACTAASQARFARKTNRYELLRKEHKNHKEIYMIELLRELFEKRKRYSFQMVKLVYLFPDDSFSENVSVNSYDRLFFQDQHIHTVVKIYETIQMQAKIWAFLNLKNLHKRRKLEKFTTKIQKVQQTLIKKAQKSAFDHLHLYSIKITPQKILTTVQRMQPINTKIDPKTLRTQETVKTERVERASILTSVRRVETDQVIRLGEAHSPVVRRIHLTPDDVKIIYPSTSTNVRKEVVGDSEVRRVYYPSVPTERITERQHTTKQTNNTHTYTHTNYNTRTVLPEPTPIRHPTQIHSTQTIRKIEPVQVHTIPTSYYRSDYEIRGTGSGSGRAIGRHPYGYDYLVHTVQGDCTINVYNGSEDRERDRVELVEGQRNKSVSHSRPSIAVHTPDSSQHYCTANHIQRSCCHTNTHCHPQVHPCCSYQSCSNSHSSSHSCSHSCSCSLQCPYQSQQCRSLSASNCQISRQPTSQSYFIQDRIEYLKKLEEINNKMDLSKRFSKD